MNQYDELAQTVRRSKVRSADPPPKIEKPITKADIAEAVRKIRERQSDAPAADRR